MPAWAVVEMRQPLATPLGTDDGVWPVRLPVGAQALGQRPQAVHHCCTRPATAVGHRALSLCCCSAGRRWRDQVWQACWAAWHWELLTPSCCASAFGTCPRCRGRGSSAPRGSACRPSRRPPTGNSSTRPHPVSRRSRRRSGRAGHAAGPRGAPRPADAALDWRPADDRGCLAFRFMGCSVRGDPRAPRLLRSSSAAHDTSRTAIVRRMSSAPVHNVQVRVLVVEDHVALANRIGEGLRDAGFRRRRGLRRRGSPGEHGQHRLRRGRARPRPAGACTATRSAADWCATARPAAS